MRNDTFRLIRLYAGMSQREFAEFIGVSKSTVGLIEIGQRSVTPRVQARLVAKYDLTDDFFAYLEKFRKSSQ